MSDHHSHLWPGVPFALGSAVLFGASAPLSKLLIGSIDPWLLAGISISGQDRPCHRALGAAMLGLANVEAPLQKPTFHGCGRDALRRMLGPLFLMLGLSQTTAASGSLLLNLEGLATMAIAWLVFRENVDRRLLLGAAAILGGAVLLSWNGKVFASMPAALHCAGVPVLGDDNNLTRKLSSADPVQIAMIKGLSPVARTVLWRFLSVLRCPSAGLIGLALWSDFLALV